jgi:hypothetical protein
VTNTYHYLPSSEPLVVNGARKSWSAKRTKYEERREEESATERRELIGVGVCQGGGVGRVPVVD